MVAIPDATWVDNVVDAVDLRKSLGAGIVTPDAPTAPRPGRLAGPGTPLTVTPTAPASMAVLVKAGKAVTYRSAAYGPIVGLGPDGDVIVPIPAAPASGSQWHRIYLLQRDVLAPANDSSAGAVVDVISGASASSPTAPPLPAGALFLADVVVPAGNATVTASMVTDRPTWTAPRGGVLPVADRAERQTLAAYPTREVLELDTGRRLWHDGTRWRYEGDRVSVANTAARAALDAYAGLIADTPGGTIWRHDGTTWQGDWATLTLANGAAPQGGFQAPQYRKRGDAVELRGVINASSVANGTTMATLPVGFRPAATEVFSGVSDNGTRFDITAAGNLLRTTGNQAGYVSLSGISFVGV